MHTNRHVRLFRNGRNQALRIPRELELDADTQIKNKIIKGLKVALGTPVG